MCSFIDFFLPYLFIHSLFILALTDPARPAGQQAWGSLFTPGGALASVLKYGLGVWGGGRAFNSGPQVYVPNT